MDLTVEWEAVTPHHVVIHVPDDATPGEKLAAAHKAAGNFVKDGSGVLRGTVRYQADDGTFGGSIA